MDSFGKDFTVTIFGESHGPCIGVVIDGVQSGISLKESDFTLDLARRAPHQKGTTARQEEDRVNILSGVYEGHTTGAPLTLTIDNRDTRSSDYSFNLESGQNSHIKGTPRPGHSDYTAAIKFNGFNDPRGGGMFSGRITAAIVAAGVVAKKMLPEISISAKILQIGGCKDPQSWEALIDEATKTGDSLGGIVQCECKGLPAGWGEPFWDSVESLISHAIFAIPGVRGIEFGDGFAAAAMKGSLHNDPIGENGPLKNGSGGVNGGISNGAPIVFRVAFKPTSSIAKAQETFNFSKGEVDTLQIKGRHDVCFAQRCPVIVEAMSAIVLADLSRRVKYPTCLP